MKKIYSIPDIKIKAFCGEAVVTGSGSTAEMLANEFLDEYGKTNTLQDRVTLRITF